MSKSSHFTKTIVTTALLAGTFDILSAFTYTYIGSGRQPVLVLQYVASGVLGSAAFTGGWFSAIYGLLFHYFIAFTFAALFFLIYPKLKFLAQNIILSGVAYGIFVWVVMNLMVVPLSNVNRRPFTMQSVVINMVILIFAIGIPIAIRAKQYYKN
jgi:hypothetical protein